MQRRAWYSFGTFILIVLVLVLVGIPSLSPMPEVATGQPAAQGGFAPAAIQGFGDRQNSWVWSMQWWNGHLYVGTNRAWLCAETAALNRLFPSIVPYPPDDPDVECTSEVADLPLQAEIWRWSPDTEEWQRVYQSPQDIPIPDQPGKFVARDIGYRGMTVFREADGTEALYVAGVSARFLGYDTPPPRILRSTDGVNFTPLPQQPGTTLGDLPWVSFRDPTEYNGRFYIVAGSIQGSGVLLEAIDPREGNDSFRVINPPESVVSAIEPYNNQLYVGFRSRTDGYRVARTTASGELPYAFDVVVPYGAYVTRNPNSEVLDMEEFQGQLYVGGNGILSGATVGLVGGAEMVRINPDDTWDLIVGDPRFGPEGLILPLSGYFAGFDDQYNGHIWQLEVFEDHLYVGTFDSRTLLRNDPQVEPYIRELQGFDLYRTADGINFEIVTRTGFDDPFSFGVRGLEATPYGLFLGSTNHYFGLQIWRKATVDRRIIYLPVAQRPWPVYLPTIVQSLENIQPLKDYITE